MAVDERPPKPYDTFPLFAHSRGYWCKKIDGRQESFGKWAWPNLQEYEASWREAKRAYETFMERRATGQEVAAKPGNVTVQTLVDAYLTHQEDRVGRRELKSATFAQQRRYLTSFRDAIGRHLRIGELERDPNRLVAWINDVKGRYGYYAHNKAIGIVAGMFIWAEHPITGILGQPFRLRPLLKPLPENTRKREKREREAVMGKQRWTVDELTAMLNHARNPLRAWVKLAYYAAFGATDIADLPGAGLKLDPDADAGVPSGYGLVDWYRPKTEIQRAAVLPPDLVEDLREAIALRPDPADKAYAPLLFLTRSKGPQRGLPLVRDIVHKDDEGQILKVVNVDSIAQEFRKLRDSLARCDAHGWFQGSLGKRPRRKRGDPKPAKRPPARPVAPTVCPTCGRPLTSMRKLGFYTFRHTASTYAAGAVGNVVLDLFEGRSIKGSRRHYLEEADVHDLLRIADRLSRKLQPHAPVATRNDAPWTAMAAAAEPPSAAPTAA